MCLFFTDLIWRCKVAALYGYTLMGYSALHGYKRVKATPVCCQENKKRTVWDSRLEMVWPLTEIAEVSYSLSFEHSKVSSLPREHVPCTFHVGINNLTRVTK